MNTKRTFYTTNKIESTNGTITKSNFKAVSSPIETWRDFRTEALLEAGNTVDPLEYTITIDELIRDTKEIEKLAEEYLKTVKNKKKPSQKEINRLVLDFLRRNDYSSQATSFNQLAGTPDDDFMTWMRGEYEDKKGKKTPDNLETSKKLYHKYSDFYVKKNPKTGKYDYSYSGNKGATFVHKKMILIDKNGEEQPLRHTVVCTQGVGLGTDGIYSIANGSIAKGQTWGGVAVTWGGDLSSQVAENAILKQTGKNSKNNMFSDDQLRSDVDAVNMGLNYNWDKQKSSDIFADYYKNQTDTRYTQFQENLKKEAGKKTTTEAVYVLYTSAFYGQDMRVGSWEGQLNPIQGVSKQQIERSGNDYNVSKDKLPTIPYEDYKKAGEEFANKIDNLATQEKK